MMDLHCILGWGSNKRGNGSCSSIYFVYVVFIADMALKQLGNC